MKKNGDILFLELIFAAKATLAILLVFANEEVAVRTRPLEFDSALEDDLRLRRSVFAALRDLSRSRVSWWLFVSIVISFSISLASSSRSDAASCFRWLVLTRVRFRNIRVYASLRWFLRTPVAWELWISVAVRSSHFWALGVRSDGIHASEIRGPYNNIASRSEVLRAVFTFVQWCWASPRFVVGGVRSQSSGFIFEWDLISAGRIHVFCVLCFHQSGNILRFQLVATWSRKRLTHW